MLYYAQNVIKGNLWQKNNMLVRATTLMRKEALKEATMPSPRHHHFYSRETVSAEFTHTNQSLQILVT